VCNRCEAPNESPMTNHKHKKQKQDPKKTDVNTDKSPESSPNEDTTLKRKKRKKKTAGQEPEKQSELSKLLQSTNTLFYGNMAQESLHGGPHLSQQQPHMMSGPQLPGHGYSNQGYNSQPQFYPNNTGILVELATSVKNIEHKLSKLDSIEAELGIIKNKLSTVECRLDNIDREIVMLKKDKTELNRNFEQLEESVNGLLVTSVTTESLRDEFNAMKDSNDELKDKLSDLQMRSMRENLIFSGIPEAQDENIEETLKEWLSDKMGKRDIRFDRVHRLGKQARQGRPRPIVAKFTFYKDREEVRQLAPEKLKGSNFGVNQQFPKEVFETRKKLVPIMKAARKENKKAVLVYDKLYINDVLYKHEETSNKTRSPARTAEWQKVPARR
jgi:hypothetical protein